MCKRLTVFRRADPAENDEILQILGGLPNVEIEYIRESPILQGFVNLPFIQTDEGARFFGLEGIKKFVESIY